MCPYSLWFDRLGIEIIVRHISIPTLHGELTHSSDVSNQTTRASTSLFNTYWVPYQIITIFSLRDVNLWNCVQKRNHASLTIQYNNILRRITVCENFASNLTIGKLCVPHHPWQSRRLSKGRIQSVLKVPVKSHWELIKFLDSSCLFASGDQFSALYL